MAYSHTLRGRRYQLADLRELLAKANEEKSGDCLAGVAAATCRPLRKSTAHRPHFSSSRCAEIGNPPKTDVSRIRDSPMNAYGPRNASPRA